MIKLIKIFVFSLTLEVIFTGVKVGSLFTIFDLKDEIGRKCIFESLICESVIFAFILF